MIYKRGKLSNGTVLGYGAAAAGDAGAYNFITMYMIFFMTNVAGVDPVKAGSIYSAAILCQAVLTLFIGPLTDNTKSRFGRRRPYILAGALIMFVTMIMIFTVVDLGESGDHAYYTVSCILFFMGYMLWMTPYTALGSEMTLDYDERTRLRTPATIFQYIGNIAGISLPMAAVAFMVNKGSSDAQAWKYFAVLIAAVCTISVLITWKATKGKELPPEVVFAQEPDRNPVRTYMQIIRMKPVLWMIGFVVMFFAGYMIYQSGLAYYVLYCAGMTEDQMSTALFINIFVSIAITVLISHVSKTVLDKKSSLGVCFLISAAGMIIFSITGISSMAGLLALFVCFNFGNTAFWLLLYPIEYDIAEAYDYKYGGRKEASIYTLIAFVGSVATSIGTQIMTRGLQMTGYDPSLETQSAETISGLSFTILVIPAITFILAGIFCFLFPISKKKYRILLEQKENREAGRETDESALGRII